MELRVDDYVRPEDHDVARGMRALRNAAMAAGADVRVVFPERRVYTIAERSTGGHWPGYYDWPLFFRGISGLTIEGNGSRIQQRGGYTLAANRKPWGGMRLMDCTDVLVTDLDFDGGAQTLTRDPAVTELDTLGVALDGCTGVRLERVHVRNVCSDGFQVHWHNREDGSPCQYTTGFELVDCASDGAGRNGLTISGGRNGLVSGCDFVRTGRHTYGSHAPAAGIDVEPDRYPEDGGMDPPAPLERSGKIRFERCKIADNVLRTVVCHWERVEDVAFVECEIDGHAAASDWETDFASPGTTVQRCKIRSRQVLLSHNTSRPEDAARWATFTDNEIEILPGGRGCISTGARIRHERNTIHAYGIDRPIDWQCTDSVIVGCEVFRSGVGFNASVAPWHAKFLDCTGTTIDRNVFTHDTGGDVWVIVQGSPMPTRSMLDPNVLWEVIP